MANVICVFGSPNSGSTVFSIGLARKFAKLGNNVALLCPDLISPVIPAILPQDSKKVGANESKSIGKIFANAAISYNDILLQMVTATKQDRLVLLGYALGDNNLSYPAPSEQDVYVFYQRLCEMVDIIVVDCTHDVNDVITKVALANADSIIRCGDCTFKSIAYFASNLPLVPTNNIATSDHIVVYPKVKNSDNTDEVSGIVGNSDYEIRYISEIERMSADGELLFSPYPAQYSKVIDKIVKEMVLVG